MGSWVRDWSTPAATATLCDSAWGPAGHLHLFVKGVDSLVLFCDDMFRQAQEARFGPRSIEVPGAPKEDDFDEVLLEHFIMMMTTHRQKVPWIA